MNLKLEKSKNCNNDFKTKNSRLINQQQNVKSKYNCYKLCKFLITFKKKYFLGFLSLMADQLFKTADTILENTNGFNSSDTLITQVDVNNIISKLEQIVDSGGIFSEQNPKTALNNTQQFLDILIDLIKKRLSNEDI